MYKIVLLRHGESTWNKENLFTGWTDVDLSEKGIEEAHNAGKRLQEEGFVVLNEIPKKGADNKLVVFLHPKTTNGVLIELCQEIQ